MGRAPPGRAAGGFAGGVGGVAGVGRWRRVCCPCPSGYRSLPRPPAVSSPGLRALAGMAPSGPRWGLWAPPLPNVRHAAAHPCRDAQEPGLVPATLAMALTLAVLGFPLGKVGKRQPFGTGLLSGSMNVWESAWAGAQCTNVENWAGHCLVPV